MTSMFKTLLGGKTTTTTNAPTTKRGIPAPWYWKPEMYQLERRAIFSKKWILVAHKNRFQEPGDYVQYIQANFPFFIIMDRSRQLHAFHNICRHRGFPVLHEEQGKASILACKYHGWSYGLDGKLAKAPHFEKFGDFDKAKNGLFRVHLHIDKLGFLWVNFDASATPLPWEKQFHGVDAQSRFEGFNFDEYKYDHTWGMEGDYNWKTLADNYNECLHCKTCHPDSTGIVDVTVYRTENKNGHIQHYNKRQEDGATLAAGKIQIASTYYFPNACMTVSPDFFYHMRCVPMSATKCSMQYDVYRHKDATDEKFNDIDQIFKRVLAEDKWLCNHTQKNLENGVYVNGQLHPSYESGPLYFQDLVREAVFEHYEQEKRESKEIWPASQDTSSDPNTGSELDFCRALLCQQEHVEIKW